MLCVLPLERIRKDPFVSSFQRQNAVCVSSFCGCCVFYVRVRDPRFLCQCVHRSRGTVQVTSIASLDKLKVRAVAFTAGMYCFSVEQLLDTCTRSRQNNSTTHVGVVKGELCVDSKFFDLETNCRRFDRFV